jgi:AcrR family transcriptional regulator
MVMASTPKRIGTADRLGPEKWTKAALAAIADQGTAQVSVERLARELGTTKGSFYWHFKDRSALIEAALRQWETDYTERIIERLVGVADPRARLRMLLASTFEDHPGVLIDVNLLAAGNDAAVGAALERVARKRLAFVDRIFAELQTAEGSDRAILAFSGYMGLAQLRRTAPSLAPSGARTTPYVDHAIAWLLSGRPDCAGSPRRFASQPSTPANVSTIWST